MAKFNRGDLVWGKMLSYPWWPAIVIDPKDCGRDTRKNNLMWLFWFGDYKITEVSLNKIVDFKDGYSKKFLKNSGKKHLHAIKEILMVLAKRYDLEYADFSKLFQWAENGFQITFPYKASTRYDLPEIVLKNLEKDSFQRKYESDSDDDSDTEIEKLVSDVLKGFKALEDICISCCRKNVEIVMEHPLFIGGVCHICKKIVNRINKMPFGRAQDMCIVCGQGGTLVYCSNTVCLRSFCKLCIELLAPKSSYSKILRNNDWFCYVCKSDPDSKCLIKARKNYEFKKAIPHIPIPKLKRPIHVIAHSNEVLSVLNDKKIAVEKFCTNTMDVSTNSESYSLSYKDFDKKELAEISADLVCASYFMSSTSLENRKVDVESFFIMFYRFLFRLNNARLVKPFVFFVFISTAEVIDDRVLSRVIRFLEVQPVFIKLTEKSFFVWSNIPNCSSTSCNKLSKKLKVIKEAHEKCIFSFFLEPLTNYFM